MGLATDFSLPGTPDSKISASFIRDLLGSEQPLNTSSDRLIGVLGMHVQETLDLSDSVIARGVVIAKSRIDGDLLLSRLNAASVLSFGGTFVDGTIRVADATTKGSLILREAQARGVDIQGSDIDGTVDLESARIAELVNVDSSQINGTLKMNDGAWLGGVSMRSTRVGRQISLQNATVSKRLDIQEVETPGSLLLGNARIGEIRVTGAKIGGTLSLDASSIRGPTVIESSSVGRGLFMRGATFSGTVDVTTTEVDGNLDLRGAHLTSLDLSETQVSDALQLASAGHEATWAEDTTPRIILHQARVGSLQDFASTWPDRLERELDGFSYARFGGLQSDSTELGYWRPVRWFVDWLDRDESYSPQPYLQLATVLDDAGQYRKASKIRTANRDRERRELSPTTFAWWWLSFQKHFFGYGYGLGPLKLLGVLSILVTVGCGFALRGRKQLDDPASIGWADCFWYSLGAAVPGLQLKASLNNEKWSRGIEHYFYAHRVVGYVIAVCVLAVLTRLIGEA